MQDDKQIILTVSQLTADIKRLLERSIPRSWVQGEVSNLTLHSSGHIYFTLKDANTQVRCVMFRSNAQNLIVLPQDGMQVIVQGDVTVFERAGQYQLNVQQLQVAGQGELALAFERLKKKLAGEGLFDEARKRPLPLFPRSIGIVTSPTGAAIRDIIKVARRRWPGIELILYPVQVQGMGAAAQIADAIAAFNEYGQVDLLIVGRGGGSIEDLWAFNEEITARAIHDSQIPVVSAVGHEVDYTIADFVADVRAPTPSAAAEIALPDAREVAAQLDDFAVRLKNALVSLADGYNERLKALRQSYGLNRLADLCAQKQQHLDWLAGRMGQQARAYLADRGHTIEKLSFALRTLDPSGVLQRGYSICRDAKGKTIKKAKMLKTGDALTAQFSEGSAALNVTKVMP
ncbi:MAG TPA: exodeoxyribonuclease VII large subunit [Candidatus Edwardsbacteria bacterium]|nr:exodeoxyribonuclease VII large subunit [Candidatus Edwardsbacteria bacterium]